MSASSSILFAIDYSKAFDTLSTTLIETCFKLFGFGPRFQSWIKTILKNRTFCVKNGGHISKEYPMDRGVRQGCPIAPLMFILTVELLAINVRQSDNVKGINIPGYETPHKIKQYADDTTFLLKDIIDFREILSKIKEFSEISGLKINKKKSFAMSLGLNSTFGEELFGFQIVKSVKILGVHFSTNISTSENPLNWEPKIEKIQKLFGLWSKRDLSLIGKILIIKTFGLSQFVYLMQSIGIPTKVLQRINRIFFSFLWKRRFTNRRAFEKVKRKTMCSTQEHGGLNMINIELMQTSFMLDWGCKIIREDEGSWKYAPLQFLKKVGGIKVFDSKVIQNEFKGEENIHSNFWKNVVKIWCSYNMKKSNKQTKLKLYDSIFNNSDIRYRGSVLFLDVAIKKGIFYIEDIVNENGIISFDEYLYKYGHYARAWLDYNVMVNAIRNKDIDFSDRQLRAKSFFNIPIEVITRKTIYSMLMPVENPKHIEEFWLKNNVVLEKKHWLMPFSVTKETRLQILQWKILHNIYPTAILLQKMGIVNSINCQACEVTEFSEHFFFSCKRSKPLWIEVEKFIKYSLGVTISLKLKDVMTGYFNSNERNKHNDKVIDSINHIILIGKMVIS